MVTYDIYHDRAFWGIRFPVRPFSADETIIDIVQEDLEGSRDAVLKACLQGLDLAAVLLTVVVKINRELIEHKIGFFYNFLLKKSCHKSVRYL
jgi:hypothetical protein